MRTAHSLALALACFDGLTVRCISPPGLQLPETYASVLRARGHLVEHTDAMDVSHLDVVYMAGLPAETSAGILASEARNASLYS